MLGTESHGLETVHGVRDIPALSPQEDMHELTIVIVVLDQQQ